MATESARAWTYTGGYPDTLKLSTLKVPTAIEGDGKMRLNMNACALNPVDIQMMNLPTWKWPFGDYKSEKGTVCDFSGTVVEGGKSDFKKGDEIFGMTLQPFKYAGGSLAELADMEIAGAVAAKKPKAWSHEKAAAISLVWLTAKQSVESVAKYVDASTSKRVAILGGSSATGIYTIMLAKRKGWKVVTTSSGRNKDFVTSDLKADAHVDYTTQNVRDGVSKFEPVAVIDCVGGTECIGLPSSKRYITIVGDKTGRTSMGGPYTYYDYYSPVRMAMQWFRWARGHWGLGESYDVVILGMKKDWLEEATATLSEKEIYVDSVFAFEDAKSAFERLNTGRARGKVVVKIAK